MAHYLFFDSASTTKCGEASVRALQKYAFEDYGNPSSNHIFGQTAARAIREARSFFSNHFQVQPEQVIFTGSGTEANNLALFGVLSSQICRTPKEGSQKKILPTEHAPLRILISSVEHPSVMKTAESLQDFGIKSQFIGVNSSGVLDLETSLRSQKNGDHKETPCTLMSVQTVNQITGTLFPVEEIARNAKKKFPHLTFHTDAIQAFGKLQIPRFPSPVDLVSISGHKIGGPKGVGALIVLNPKLLSSKKLRPVLWGGDQEGGMRSGTQNAGLIAGFHFAAQETLRHQQETGQHLLKLRTRFRDLLIEKHLLNQGPTQTQGSIFWNSPWNCPSSPSIVSISVPGIPSSSLASLLEDRLCLVSVGSACHSKQTTPDPVLAAMGFKPEIQKSAIRISFSKDLKIQDIDTLVLALGDSIHRAKKILQ